MDNERHCKFCGAVLSKRLQPRVVFCNLQCKLDFCNEKYFGVDTKEPLVLRLHG